MLFRSGPVEPWSGEVPRLYEVVVSLLDSDGAAVEVVAVKVVKNRTAYFNQSMMEVSVLDLVRNLEN